MIDTDETSNKPTPAQAELLSALTANPGSSVQSIKLPGFTSTAPTFQHAGCGFGYKVSRPMLRRMVAAGLLETFCLNTNTNGWRLVEGVTLKP